MATNISKFITYFSLLQETLKFKKQEDFKSRYTDVDIVLPDDFMIRENWHGNEDQFHVVEFPPKDLEVRIKSARDHLRYLKKKSNGVKYGE